MSGIGDQFKGLPMESLIGGPLSAAVTANLNLANATADFINKVGFNEDSTARMVDFSFERPGLNEKTGERTVEVVKIKAPMLAIVPIPNLQLDLVEITFNMEVKSSTSSTDKSSKEGSIKAGYSGFGASVSISGSVASSSESTRSSDQSAKYNVIVKATNKGLPEGLSRILDMMAQAVAPRDVTSFTPEKGSGGELPADAKGKDGYLLEKGEPVSAVPEDDQAGSGATQPQSSTPE